MCRDEGGGIVVAVLAEVLASVVAEAEVTSVGGRHLHATTCATVALQRHVLSKVPGRREGGGNSLNAHNSVLKSDTNGKSISRAAEWCKFQLHSNFQRGVTSA